MIKSSFFLHPPQKSLSLALDTKSVLMSGKKKYDSMRRQNIFESASCKDEKVEQFGFKSDVRIQIYSFASNV